jgi:hypothetical protein
VIGDFPSEEFRSESVKSFSWRRRPEPPIDAPPALMGYGSELELPGAIGDLSFSLNRSMMSTSLNQSMTSQDRSMSKQDLSMRSQGSLQLALPEPVPPPVGSPARPRGAPAQLSVKLPDSSDDEEEVDWRNVPYRYDTALIGVQIRPHFNPWNSSKAQIY